MHQIFPKVNQVFSYHLKNFEVINHLMASVSLRVQAEEQYEKAITKSVQKINDIQTDHPLYSKIIKSFKGLISERVHQVRFFKEQITKEAELLKEALVPVQEQMKAQLSELKNMEKDLRIHFEALTKNKNATEQKIRELDEKFILNQISTIYKQNISLRKVSQAILSEQQSMLKNLDLDYEKLKNSVNNFQAGAQERQKKIWELDIKFEEEFVDFFKKLNVHEISLIRNIQYDIDNMIKKTDIFNWQNTSQFKDRFNIKITQQLQLGQSDQYLSFKISIVSSPQLICAKVEEKSNEEKLKVLKIIFADKSQTDDFMPDIRKNYAQCRQQICDWIESFRKSGLFKFEPDHFKLNVNIFREILRISSQYQDFDCVNKVICYANSYHTTNAQNKKRTILDEIKGEKVLSDITFWKFYLLWIIRNSILTCTAKQQREVHLKTSVYSALLSNSLTMVQCGIEKHNIKNWIGKLTKTYSSISEAQLSELLKVIESAYENLEKAKRIKKE